MIKETDTDGLICKNIRQVFSERVVSASPAPSSTNPEPPALPWKQSFRVLGRELSFSEQNLCRLVITLTSVA